MGAGVRGVGGKRKSGESGKGQMKDRKKFYYFTVRLDKELFVEANDARKYMGLPWPFLVRKMMEQLITEFNVAKPVKVVGKPRGRPVGRKKK